MKHRGDAFASCHPIVNFLYFTAVIMYAIFVMHPAFLLISFFCAFFYSVYLNGKKTALFNTFALLPAVLIMGALNPLFNHAGKTILWYFPSGNPLTLESVLYGFAAGTMLVTVICWFSCYHVIMTTDKFICLFGRIIPALSLILSMVLRFVPKYKTQLKKIMSAQKAIGFDITSGNLIERAKNGLKLLSILTTWALENAIETADSMRARGYGLHGRSSFTIFRLDRRDKILLCVISGLCAVVLCGVLIGASAVQFFPFVQIAPITTGRTFIFAAYFLLCMTPAILDGQEELIWMHLKSKI